MEELILKKLKESHPGVYKQIEEELRTASNISSLITLPATTNNEEQCEETKQAVLPTMEEVKQDILPAIEEKKQITESKKPEEEKKQVAEEEKKRVKLTIVELYETLTDEEARENIKLYFTNPPLNKEYIGEKKNEQLLNKRYFTNPEWLNKEIMKTIKKKKLPESFAKTVQYCIDKDIRFLEFIDPSKRIRVDTPDLKRLTELGFASKDAFLAKRKVIHRKFNKDRENRKVKQFLLMRFFHVLCDELRNDVPIRTTNKKNKDGPPMKKRKVAVKEHLAIPDRVNMFDALFQKYIYE